MLPLLTTATLLAFELPNSTVAPLRKLEPEMVTAAAPESRKNLCIAALRTY
jgi:hypothetical protein